MTLRTVFWFFVFVALSCVSSWGWPWNLPLVLMGAWLLGTHLGRLDGEDKI